MSGRTDVDHNLPGRYPSGDGVRRRRVVVHGIVQGVGFRPFVSRLARERALAGSVRNFTGGVSIEIQGPLAELDSFLEALASHPPPISVIDDIAVEELAPQSQQGFSIAPSATEAGGTILVSPDVALCADCARELLTPGDPRYRHPFINCTNCGPRFTIIRRVPYDRPHTSMAPFAMCSHCAAEYADIDNRRYHAQPVACPECGPKLELYADIGEGVRRGGEEALRVAVELLGKGGILAIKGIGGFHLACDADNEEAVQELRRRKRREQKPLAVMVASLPAARDLAYLDESAEALLSSPQAPIVLVPKRPDRPLAPGIAPDSSDYGLLLPYSPLHLLLLHDAPYRALVMTSGNLADEPLCTDNEEARGRLSSIAGAFLWHDREILVGCDDSVLRSGPCGPIFIRRARGYVPFPVRLKSTARPVLAVGGQIKNTFCLTCGDNAFLSQHMGDLEDSRSLAFFERSVEHFRSILQTEPELVACDLHPDYLSTRYARRWAEEGGRPLVAVQHHHAHIVSCLADSGHTGRVVGLACDGTGLGDDGTIWGCEVLVCDAGGYRRAGHLRPVPLPGGDRAIREPWRSALAMLSQFGLDEELQWLREASAAAVPEHHWELVSAMLRGSVNCPVASSAGRLFDAVAAISGVHLTGAYEGQAAMALETVAVPAPEAYPRVVIAGPDGILVMDPARTLRSIVHDLRSGVAVGRVAGRFHRSFALMLCDCAEQVAAAEQIQHVALSGGTFQNRLLLDMLCTELERRGLTPLCHRRVPPNDGGLSLGQALIANASKGA